MSAWLACKVVPCHRICCPRGMTHGFKKLTGRTRERRPPAGFSRFAPGGKSENPTRNGRFTARNPSGWPRPVRQFRFPAGSGQIDPSRTRSCHFWPFPGSANPSGKIHFWPNLVKNWPFPAWNFTRGYKQNSIFPYTPLPLNPPYGFPEAVRLRFGCVRETLAQRLLQNDLKAGGVKKSVFQMD